MTTFARIASARSRFCDAKNRTSAAEHLLYIANSSHLHIGLVVGVAEWSVEHTLEQTLTHLQ